MGDEDEWLACRANERQTEHEIYDEEVWHYCYRWRGLLVALLVKISDDGPMIPLRFLTGSEVL